MGLDCENGGRMGTGWVRGWEMWMVLGVCHNGESVTAQVGGRSEIGAWEMSFGSGSIRVT